MDLVLEIVASMLQVTGTHSCYRCMFRNLPIMCWNHTTMPHSSPLLLGLTLKPFAFFTIPVLISIAWMLLSFTAPFPKLCAYKYLTSIFIKYPPHKTSFTHPSTEAVWLNNFFSTFCSFVTKCCLLLICNTLQIYKSNKLCYCWLKGYLLSSSVLCSTFRVRTFTFSTVARDRRGFIKLTAAVLRNLLARPRVGELNQLGLARAPPPAVAPPSLCQHSKDMQRRQNTITKME